MSLATKYALTGLLWGLVLGYGVVAITTGLGVAVLFTVVYGDGPWGDGVGDLLYGLAALGWIGSAVFCTGLGYVHGWRMQRMLKEDELRDEHHRAFLFAAAAVLAAVLGGYQLYANNSALTLRQNYLDEALQARYEIRSLQIVEDKNAQGLDVTVNAYGRRKGQYALELSVSDERGRMLYDTRNKLDVGLQEVHERIHIAYSTVMPVEVASEDAGDGVGLRRLQLTLVARLTPLLTQRELRTLPRHAAENYQAKDSPFHSSLKASHVVRWRSAAGRRWIAGQDGDMHELSR